MKQMLLNGGERLPRYTVNFAGKDHLMQIDEIVAHLKRHKTKYLALIDDLHEYVEIDRSGKELAYLCHALDSLFVNECIASPTAQSIIHRYPSAFRKNLLSVLELLFKPDTPFTAWLDCDSVGVKDTNEVRHLILGFIYTFIEEM